MNQELSTNPFNPIAPPKAFDEIKVSWPALSGFCHGRLAKLRSQKPSTIARSSLSGTACSARVSLDQSKIMNVFVANISA